jgi:hypothetical protein
MSQLPSNKIAIQIAENSYEVSFPNTGQLIDIERNKKKMSEGYDFELATGSADSAYAKILIDTIVTFNVLIPNLTKDLNVNSIRDLSLVESKNLADAYLSVYLPWYNEWVNLINKTGKEDETTEA